MATADTQALTTKPNPAKVNATRARRLRRGTARVASLIGHVREAIAEAMHGMQQMRRERPVQRRAQH